MPKSPLIRSEMHPYHITSRCNNKEFFPILLSEVWKIMLAELARAEQKHSIQVHAFVLMGNHFHLLCHTPKGNLDKVMHSFLRNTSLKIMRRADGVNHLWGGRYRWSLITNQSYYYQAYRYIYQNPVRAKLVERVEDYTYSSLMGVMPFGLHDSLPVQMGGMKALLNWLNHFIEEEDQRLIQLGLRKSQFDVNKKRMKLFEKLERPKGT